MLPGFVAGAIFFRRIETLLREIGPRLVPLPPNEVATIAPAAAMRAGVPGTLFCREEKNMKTRSPLQLCAPMVIFALACALSVSTCVLAFVWMTIGVCCLGYRRLDEFPAVGMPRAWRQGLRGACLHFYHLAWWPWYMRNEMRQLFSRIQGSIFARRTQTGEPEVSGENDRTDQQ